MLETQSAAGLVELGNRAEMILHERSEEHNTELQMMKNRAEAYIGFQSQDISKLRHELNQASEELQTIYLGREQSLLHQPEVELMAKANSQHHEAEVSLMQNAINDRSAVFNSELVNLRSTIQSQKDQSANRSGFTDEEIRSYLSKKLMMFRDEYQQESITLQAMIQSESDVAKLYKGRYEHIAQSALGKDPSSDHIIKSLKSRLDHEADHTDIYRRKHTKASEELNEMRMELKVEN